MLVSLNFTVAQHEIWGPLVLCWPAGEDLSTSLAQIDPRHKIINKSILKDLFE